MRVVANAHCVVKYAVSSIAVGVVTCSPRRGGQAKLAWVAGWLNKATLYPRLVAERMQQISRFRATRLMRPTPNVNRPAETRRK